MKKNKLTGPTYLTIARMIVAVVFMVFVLIPATWTRIVALILFVAGAISDLIDGKWARKQKIVTDLGAFLDPLADKMLVNLAFLALVDIGAVPVWVFAIILVRDFAVDGMRMMAARDGVTIAASLYGKLKTTLQLTALIIIQLNLVVNINLFTILGNIALYVALILTVFSGADYLIKGWKKLIK
ncbi:CDP-diacylglycerol--glycerol-3-phosphate 3-phosphatidyltransferase [Candidatus Saccharibacteria bacterium]|nr:CDP-diacylglycerol--glycerol-3-phosphate 3-phosphatidyltransferase [Candidatus Saccharibacteria bacterium]